MPTPLSSITRAATRKTDEPLNILTFPTHERYETGLCKTGHNFYSWRSLDGSIKDWDETYAKLPNNYSLLNPYNVKNQLPPWVDFDLVLSQNKFGQYQIARNIAGQLQLPLVSLEHTLPVPTWDYAQLEALKQMAGNVNVFISDFSREAWGWGKEEAVIVHHGIDTEVFKPIDGTIKKNHILSVVNDWINRDWCCNFKLWQTITQNLPVFPVGKTPGLSQPAKDIDELVRFYNEARIFVNTSRISPVPTALLEAMSCGCAVVTTSTCMIPEIVKNGYNGYISNDHKELRNYLDILLKNPDKCYELGQNARNTITNKFSMDKFIENWNNIFYSAAKGN